MSYTSGIGKINEVTHEERQFILSICEQFAKNKTSVRTPKDLNVKSPFQAALESAENIHKNKH
jgi:hypothetical protein